MDLIVLIDWKWLITLSIALMVFCFGIYKYFDTKKTGKKARQIAEIDKQLVKLYYPLMDILKNPPPNLRIDDIEYYLDRKKIDKITPFQHLVSDDLKDLLEKIIENALVERSIDMDNFRELVEADIERLKRELQSIKNS